MLTSFQSNGLHLSTGCLDARSPLPLKLPSLTGLPSILLDKIRARKPFSGILLPFAHNIDLLVLFSYSQRSIKMTLGLLMPACSQSLESRSNGVILDCKMVRRQRVGFSIKRKNLKRGSRHKILVLFLHEG